PKSNDPCFKNTNNYLIGSVKSAVKNLQKYFSQNSFVVNYYSNQITGEAKDYAENMYKLIQKKRKEMIKNEIEKLVLIGSGELTVTIKGGGIGGRNQEMLLSLINIMKNQEINYPFLILGANLDGIEGNSKAMGALIDRNVIQKAKDKDIQKYLKNNDSNSFFKKIGTEIITGPTGCNVNDIILGILR
ncbi:MAG: MOFRL family protein, partial [Promethearchaeati archaeon]